MKKSLSVLLLLQFVYAVFSQTTPIYLNENKVTIVGYTLDAMEPQISADGNALFFNSLNDGITTSLYYAAKINDSTFNFLGAVPVVNQTVTPRLDAVACLDSASNFFWVSTRGWPTNIENVHRIKFLTSGYTNFGRLHGDFYINNPGFLIMDACINFQGNTLIYCNAYFNNCNGNAIPCSCSMGIASKLNDSTFNKIANTSAIMANVNDTVNYIVYAPNITKDGLELYYTRLLKGGTQTEIMVATRTGTNLPFSNPTLLIGSPNLYPEAATISSDKSKLYYHKKVGGIYKLYLRSRGTVSSLKQSNYASLISIYPNPSNDIFNIQLQISDLSIPTSIEVVDVFSQIVLTDKFFTGNYQLNLVNNAKGIYFLKLTIDGVSKTIKIIKE